MALYDSFHLHPHLAVSQPFLLPITRLPVIIYFHVFLSHFFPCRTEATGKKVIYTENIEKKCFYNVCDCNDYHLILS